MHVLIADKVERELIDALEAGGCTVTCQPELEGDAIAAVLNEHASGALIVRSTKVREPVLAAAPDSLRLIVRAGAGYDNIDHAFAAMREISVCNCPGMNAVAVAELAMGHLIALDRRLVEQTNEMRAGHWFKKEYAKARGL
ncbi:MAG: hydroxyacid dehydrogenase, partial [Planctomycetota bacterium]